LKTILLNQIEKLTKRIEQLAKEIKFIQRENCSISGVEFVHLMSVILFSNNDAKTLQQQCDDLKQGFNINITSQALSARQNRKTAKIFLEKVYQLILEEQIDEIIEQNDIFKEFKNVYLQDSSIINFYKIKSEFFKGSGGSKNQSSYKLNLIFNIAKMSVKSMTIHGANENDQSLSPNTLEHLNRGDLHIADLGYFVLGDFKKMDDIGAYFLSRYKSRTNIYLKKEDKDKFDLISYLGKQKGNIIEFEEIYIGKNERLKSRIICYRLPKDVADNRIRKKRAEYKKRGVNSPSKDLLESLKYAIFITNIPKEKVSAEMVGTLYKIRWQIELIFKEFKSLMNIDVMHGKNEATINTFIYGKLISILLITDIKRLAMLYAKKVDRELSFVKLISHLKYNQKLEKAILNGEILDLLKEIERDIAKYCKTKRKRKTSRQLLEENVGFLETFL
jgi:hypothetical protein